MCNPSPAPRCSQSAFDRLTKAQEAAERVLSPANTAKLKLAQRQFLLTPRGLQRLREHDEKLAESFNNERSRRLRLAKFSQPLTTIQSQWHGDTVLIQQLSTEPIVQEAFRIAVIAHAEVSRKNGEPYMNHPLRTALRLSMYSPAIQAIALLHDSVEDSDLELSDLCYFGFPQLLIDAVDAVTKRQGESYMEAIHRAADNPFAMLVKLADTLDNSSVDQLACFSNEKREKQRAKYREAHAILLPAIRKRESVRQALLAR